MPVDVELSERLARCGEGLSAGTIRWGERDDSSSVALSERDLGLLALVYEANLLASSQLVALGWGAGAERAGQRRLKKLNDGGYLKRLRPAVGRGSAEWIYQLSTAGHAALCEGGLAPRDRFYSPAAITSIAYAEHDLQVAALVLSIAAQAEGEFEGGLLALMPFEWQGPRSGRIERGERHGGERSAAAKLAAGTRLHHGESRAGYLEPDATLIGGSGDERWAVLIEYDRTERPHKQLDRLRRYDRFLLEGWRDGRFAAHAIAPSVVFVTARERPLRALIEAADQTFSAWYGGEHAGPREGTHPARQRVVFTSRERVLAGEWGVWRVPALPAGVRREAGCVARAVSYDLPGLFGGG